MKYLLAAMAICMLQSARAERPIEPVIMLSATQAAQLLDQEGGNLLAQEPAGVLLDWSVSDPEMTDLINAMPATAAGFSGIIMIDAERAEALLGSEQ